MDRLWSGSAKRSPAPNPTPLVLPLVPTIPRTSSIRPAPRAPQGRPGDPPQRPAPVLSDGFLVQVQRARCLDPVPFLRVRLLGMGDLGSAAPWRHARNRPLAHLA